MMNKTQGERDRMKGGPRENRALWPQLQEWLSNLPLLLPVNFGAPQSWVSSKLHIMGSHGGGRGGGCGPENNRGGHRLHLGRLHKWLRILSHDIFLSASHLIVTLQTRHTRNLPSGRVCYCHCSHTVSWGTQSRETVINWEGIPVIHLTQLCTRVTATKVHL